MPVLPDGTQYPWWQSPPTTGAVPNLNLQSGLPGTSNLVYSPVGSSEKILQDLFKGSATGQGGGALAQTLYNYGQGQLPPALSEQLTAQTNEQFGKVGNRFGTDLATAISRGLAQASEAQSLSALNSIMGLGQNASQFQFLRGENALNRALQEFLGSQQTDPMVRLLFSLLGDAA